MNKEDKIGVFDSGIGGVTVLKEILKVLPNENYIYYSDSANNPYGDKTQEDLINICDEIVKYLIEQKCKAIVIACNTASAKVVNILRERYKTIPFIAIEPAYKMVHDFAYDKPTLIMATNGTIESERFNILYTKYNNHKTYILPCVGLADIIENGEKKALKEYLIGNLSEYKGKVENVVLGCTHYPLIQDEIKEVLGNVKFFNGAPNLAMHLKDVLIEKNLLNKYGNGEIEFIDSSNIKEKEERFWNILSNTCNYCEIMLI